MSRDPNTPTPLRVALGALILTLVGAAPLVASALREGGPPPEQRPVRFGRDIRPLFSDRCFRCHGPDVSTRKADLRLDTFEHATRERDGLRPIAPGDPGASEVWRRISSADPDDAMPPEGSHRPRLDAGELELVRRWIEAGASYEAHWSFVPPARPPLPQLDEAHPIDAFAAAELAQRGFELSGEERPDLLLRRIFLDLTGLPPTPEELDEFLAAYEPAADRDAVWLGWVGRLFGEEPYRTRYAERMASPWLDQARYADTNGIHMDAGRQIWPWRDWVLGAYRENLPFDRFLTEQLAGDLLPDATVDQLVASGFHRNHVVTDEGGAIDAEYLVEYAVDRVNTTGSVFLGLTLGCARCHDHKFDPVSQEDYYRLFAFFGSNDEPGLYSQLPDPNRAFEPFLEVPSEEQLALRAELAAELAAGQARLDEPSAEDLVALEAYRAELPGELGLEWVAAELVGAASRGGAEFAEQADGSLLARGANPATDVHSFTLRTAELDLRLLQLDVLGHADHANGAPGRADNGNAVLTSIAVEAVSVSDPNRRRSIPLVWAWADHAQDNDDYHVLRAFDERPNTGWAIAGHTDGGERTALFLAGEPFGYEGGTDVVVTLGYESIWAAHVFGRVRLSLARLGQQGVGRLPLARGHWYHAGPFELGDASTAYAVELGLEGDTALDPTADWPAAEGPALRWRFRADLRDGAVAALPSGVNAHFLGKELYSSEAREVELSLGSDDGFALYLNGERVLAREVPRGVAPDQDRVTVELRPGRNVVVLKVINTGGQSGFYFEALEAEGLLAGDLVATLVEPAARADGGAALEQRLLHAWRLERSPEYAALLEELSGLEAAQAELEAAVPRTMIMRERAEPRETFVLRRGEYDKADPERPVDPDLPRLFGSLDTGDQRPTRLDLARWLTAPDNPLVARVAANRLWQLLFGRGLVETSGDFGYQGAWPSHPELLDWLAVELVDSGWDVQALLTTIVTSRTYRQSSRQRPELLAVDPEGRLLGSYPRRRLEAEILRDQALYVAGLLVEELGGPSVKPYQPPGLWREVAMNQSNTRTFERGAGADLWRRSLYTYWKRAAPPPSLLTFDAPTRESCAVRRSITNTPLQALVLWNDEQFVEAARALAERTLAGPAATDDERLVEIFRRCTGRPPEGPELELLRAALADHRTRYAANPADAEALLSVGEAPRAMDLEAPELAAWTLIASAVLNLHATLTQG